MIFRRTSPQITNEGALWDEAGRLYALIGGTPRVGDMLFQFPSGASIGFGHLQHEHTKLDWQASQIPLIGFDELTTSRARSFSTCCRVTARCAVFGPTSARHATRTLIAGLPSLSLVLLIIEAIGQYRSSGARQAFNYGPAYTYIIGAATPFRN